MINNHSALSGLLSGFQFDIDILSQDTSFRNGMR